MLAKVYPAAEPGAAAIVTRDGKPILRKGYGMADVELGIGIEPNIVFRIGSMTKQFTAVATLMLVQEGKIKLDDPMHGKVELKRVSSGAEEGRSPDRPVTSEASDPELGSLLPRRTRADARVVDLEIDPPRRTPDASHSDPLLP